MMKRKILSLLLVLVWANGFTQSQRMVEQYKDSLAHANNDIDRVLAMGMLTWAYQYVNTDSAFYYGNEAISLADKINYPRGKVRALGFISNVYWGMGNLPKALESGLLGLEIADNYKVGSSKAVPLHAIGSVYQSLKDYPKALYYFRQTKQICEQDLANELPGVAFAEVSIGAALEELNQLDSATYYSKQSEKHFIEGKFSVSPTVYAILGQVQFKLGNPRLALAEYHKSLESGYQNEDHFFTAAAYLLIARLYKSLNKQDSSIYFAKKSLSEAEIISSKQTILDAAKFIFEQYDSINPGEALYYYKMATSAKDSLFGAGNIQAIQEMVKQVEERKKDAATAKILYQNQLKQYALLAGLGVMFLVGFMLYRNNHLKQKAYNLLHRQKQEIDFQRDKAEKTLIELKSTQTQLIQSEKLASLGELTAGIAHEIQNPLNFVNNFAEVSAEMLVEMDAELDKGDVQEAKAISADLQQNLSKINHHGQRASSIVKGMLEHSRTSSGVKEPTDINALADEFLRLAYHGLRAKDNNFDATMETHFDPDLPKISVIPQDIGRVLLNLINNAFYAVHQRAIVGVTRSHADNMYQPTVTISTQKIGDHIIIKVQDNGPGIPKAIIDKIFQPFFTTKPTGQGTGLGLSLSYDIIKAHGGELKVETKEGEGSAFTIQIPLP